MQRNSSRKIVASVCAALMLALEIFGVSGLLIPYSTEEVGIRFNTLVYPYRYMLLLGFLADFLIFLYLLYSFGMLGKAKTDPERQFVHFTDVGLILLATVKAVDTYFWHYGLFGLCIIFRVLMLLILLRINLAFQSVLGRRKGIYWPRWPFDIYWGYCQYLLVLALGTAMTAWPWGDQIFTPGARAVLLLLALATLSMVTGLRQLNPVSMLTVVIIEGLITAQHLLPEPAYDGRFPEVYIASILSMAALVASILAALIKRRRN